MENRFGKYNFVKPVDKIFIVRYFDNESFVKTIKEGHDGTFVYQHRESC